MGKKKKREVHETVETKSVNGVLLTVERGIEEDYAGRDRNFWRVMAGEKYIDQADDSIGKMHSFGTKECTTFEAFVAEFEQIHVFKRLNYSRGGYMIRDLYSSTTKEEFEATMDDVKSALDADLKVEYNDDHGVGYFIKEGQDKYEAHHFRYCTERVETLNIDGIKNFLRDFHEVGCHDVREYDW